MTAGTCSRGHGSLHPLTMLMSAGATTLVRLIGMPTAHDAAGDIVPPITLAEMAVAAGTDDEGLGYGLRVFTVAGAL